VAGKARDTIDAVLYDARLKNLRRASSSTNIGARLKKRLRDDKEVPEVVDEYLRAYKHPGAGLEVGASYGALLGAALGGYTHFAGGEAPLSALARGGLAGLIGGAALGGAAGLLSRFLAKRKMRRKMYDVYYGDR
jgi:hypothetical protein